MSSVENSVQLKIQDYVNSHPACQNKPLSEFASELIAAGIVTQAELDTLPQTSTFSLITTSGEMSVTDTFTHSEEEEVSDGEPANGSGEQRVVQQAEKYTIEAFLDQIKPPLSVRKTQDGQNTTAEVYNGVILVAKAYRIVNDDNEVEEAIIKYQNNEISQKTVLDDGKIVEVRKYDRKQIQVPMRPTVEIVTIGSDGSQSVTIVDNIDSDGNYFDGDFRARQSIEGVESDRKVTAVFVGQNGKLCERIEQNGTVVFNEYNGSSIADYDSDRKAEGQVSGQYENKNNKLHKTYQVIRRPDGTTQSVQYDGNGNTITHAKNNDSVSRLVKQFNMTTKEFYRLNPSLEKQTLQVAQDVVISNERSADAPELAAQGTIEAAFGNYYKYVTVPKIRQELARGDMSDVTLDKTYRDVYAYATELLKKEGYTGKEHNFKDLVNDRANALLWINPPGTQFKAGTSIKSISGISNKQTRSELEQYGVALTNNNKGFVQAYQKLSDYDKVKVRDILQYCKNKKITDEYSIKREVFNRLGINMFESGKNIGRFASKDMFGRDNMNGGVVAAQYSSYPGENGKSQNIPVEMFITDILKVDINSPQGRDLYMRISQQSQEALDRISYSQFENMAPTLKNNQSSFFNMIADKFGAVGTPIRTYNEQVMYNKKLADSPAYFQQKAAEMLYNATSNALSTIQNYLNELKSHPITNIADIMIEDVRFYFISNRGLRALIKELGINSGTVDAFTKDLYTKIDELAELRNKAIRLRESAGSADFNNKYRELTGQDYSEADMRELIELSSPQSNPFGLPKPQPTQAELDKNRERQETLIKRILGNQSETGENAGDYVSASKFSAGVIEMAAMVYFTAGFGSAGYVKSGAAAVAELTGAAWVGTGTAGMLTVGSYTLGRECFNIFDDVLLSTGITSDSTFDSQSAGEVIWNRAKRIGGRTALSGAFGFVGGATAPTIASWSQKAQNFVSNGLANMFGESSSAIVPISYADSIGSFAEAAASDAILTAENVAAAQNIFASGNTLTGAEFLAKTVTHSIELNYIGKATQLVLEVLTFTGAEVTYETAKNIASDIFSEDSGLKQAIKEDKVEEYVKNRIKDLPSAVWEQLKNQGINAIMLKAMAFAIGSSIGNDFSSQYETLNNSKVYTEVIDGQTKYVVEGTSGKLYCDSPAQVLSFLHMTAIAEDFIKAQSSEQAGSSNGGTALSVQPSWGTPFPTAQQGWGGSPSTIAFAGWAAGSSFNPGVAGGGASVNPAMAAVKGSTGGAEGNTNNQNAGAEAKGNEQVRPEDIPDADPSGSLKLSTRVKNKIKSLIKKLPIYERVRQGIDNAVKARASKPESKGVDPEEFIGGYKQTAEDPLNTLVKVQKMIESPQFKDLVQRMAEHQIACGKSPETVHEILSNMTNISDVFQLLIEQSGVGPTKLAQILSNMTDLMGKIQSFSPELEDAIQQTRSNCNPSRTVEEAQADIDAAFPMDMGDGVLFYDEANPILSGAQHKYKVIKRMGTASMGETYLCEKANGDRCVVKMLKKGVDATQLELEEEFYTMLVETFNSNPESAKSQIEIIHNSYQSWAEELNFDAEFQNSQKLADNAKRYTVAKATQVSPDGQCLVMDLAQGVQMSELLDMMKFYKENPQEYSAKFEKEIGRNPWLGNPEKVIADLPKSLLGAFTEQFLFMDSNGQSIMHGDPHMGNYFIHPDAEGNLVPEFIDTGLCVTRTGETIKQDINFFASYFIGNSRGVAEYALERCNLSPDQKALVIDDVTADIQAQIFNQHTNITKPDFVSTKIDEILAQHNLKMSSDNSTSMKAQLQFLAAISEIKHLAGGRVEVSDIIQEMPKALWALTKNGAFPYQEIVDAIKFAFHNQTQTVSTIYQLFPRN